MQLPPIGLPRTAPTAAAASNQRVLEAQEKFLSDLAILTGKQTAQPAAGPVQPVYTPCLVPGPIGELLDQVGAAGYRFRLKTDDKSHLVEPAELAGQLQDAPDATYARLEVERVPPQLPVSSFSNLRALSLMETQKIKVSSWNALDNLRTLVSGAAPTETGRTLAALETAGALLFTAGKDYQGNDSALMHRKLLKVGDEILFSAPVVDESPPLLAGAYGATLASPAQLWVQGPTATQPTRLCSLDEARYFLLHESVPALDDHPKARQLRDLEDQGVQFRVPTNSTFGSNNLGALAAFQATGPLELRVGGASVCQTSPSPHGKLDVPPDLQDAIAYLRDNPGANKGLLQILALPTGLPVDEKLALVERLTQTKLPLAPSGKIYAGPPRSSVLEVLTNLSKTPGRPMAELVDQYFALSARGQVLPDWASGASAYLLDHPQDEERLLALGRLGGKEFEVSLQADKLLQASGQPYSEALQALAGLTNPERPGSVAQAVELFPRLLAERNPQLELAEDGRLTGLLVKRFGAEKAFVFREQLRSLPGAEADKVDRFMRESHLSGLAASALRCLEPGGHPDLPEPLEVREEAARLVDGDAFKRDPWFASDINLNAYFDSDNQSMVFVGQSSKPGIPLYNFLLELPGRTLLEDARTFSGMVPAFNQEQAKEMLTELKQGKLGRLTGPELLERLRVELALQGTNQLAVDSVRAGLPDFEQRQQLASKLTGRFEKVPETFKALQTPLPPQTSLDEGIEALSRLHQALDPMVGDQATREAYGHVVDSVRDGAWQGHTLQEGVNRFLQLAAVGDYDQAVQGLRRSPAEGGFVAGVRLDQGGVTVGGVRLRTRS